VTNRDHTQASGSLAGVRVLECANIGPGPHCGMLLSDLGAEVLRIDRREGGPSAKRIVDRGRYRLAVEIREPGGRDLCRAIAEKTNIVLEGLRPGVMERLGLEPQSLCGANSQLSYVRLAAWGQIGQRAIRS
jgi:alpha-methylacyl-CoA racemase